MRSWQRCSHRKKQQIRSEAVRLRITPIRLRDRLITSLRSRAATSRQGRPVTSLRSRTAIRRQDRLVTSLRSREATRQRGRTITSLRSREATRLQDRLVISLRNRAVIRQQGRIIINYQQAQQGGYPSAGPNNYQQAQQGGYPPAGPNNYQQTRQGSGNMGRNNNNPQQYTYSPTPFDSKIPEVPIGGYIAWAVVDILFSLLFGILGLVFVLKINKSETPEEQQKNIKYAKIFLIIGSAIGVLNLVIMFISNSL